MKIIDSFLFFNEIDMLLFRLKELNDYVDKFVIVESTHTFSGKKKELTYQNNIELFKDYEDKIQHIFTNNYVENGTSWEREAFQRNAIEYGLDVLNLDNDDVVIISDCDEIPNTKILQEIRVNPKMLNFPLQINALEQDFYYYNLTSKKKNKWLMSKIVSYELIKSGCPPQNIRHHYHQIIKDGGWHFSYFASPEKIRRKIESFSHTEFDDEMYKNVTTIEKNIELKQDLFFRDNEELINCEINEAGLPKYYKMLSNIK